MDETRPWSNNNLASSLSLLALVATVLLGAMAWNEIKSSRYIGSEAEHTITVTGLGESFGKPDVATFTFSATAEAKVVADAQTKAAATIDRSLAFVREQGVEERDIKTIGYEVYPRYEYRQSSTRVCTPEYCPPAGEQVLAGYTVTQTISVKVRDTAKAGALLGGVGNAGASNISGLTFMIDDEDALKRDARTQAIEKAKEKARELAGDLGVRLVRITAFSESGDTPVYAKLGMAAERDGAAPAANLEVPAGENRIVSNVTLTYEIRD